MPFLEIRHPSGEFEHRELKKQAPLTIGRHSSNDIVIDEPDVAVMHCRISWMKGGFEAVAAGAEPLDVNGILKQRSGLTNGDTLRFGSIDLRYWEDAFNPTDSGAQTQADAADHMEAPRESFAPRRGESARGPEAPASPPAAKPSKPREKPAAKPAPPSGKPVWKSPLTPQPVPSVPEAEEIIDDEFLEEVEVVEDAAIAASSEDTLSERVRKAVRSQQSRPGEEDPLSSPLVLGLVGGSAVLIFLGAIFYFIATRQTAQQAFDAAHDAYEQGNYRSSIEQLENFIGSHGRGKLRTEAEALLGLSKVRQLIEGAAPQYADGLAELRKFITQQQDREGFANLHPDLFQLAKAISLGAAQQAGPRADPSLLEVSRQARTLIVTYAPATVPPTETLDQIEQVQRASQSLILKDDVIRNHLSEIDAALKNQQPLQAMRKRRQLLQRYPELARDPQVMKRFSQTLEMESEKVVVNQMERSAKREDHRWPANVLTPGFHARTQKDEVATGQAVLVLAEDCCYGVEMVTGNPLWRRAVGWGTPFFPMRVEDDDGVLLFDTNFQELVRLKLSTGGLVWRQPLGTDLTGTPCLLEGTLYVPTGDSQLLSIDVKSGNLQSVLQFSQPVGSPVFLEDGQQLAVSGRQEVLYLLDVHPLTCVGVYDLGQPAGSIEAPLLAVAKYLTAIENRGDRAHLHLLGVGAVGEQTAATIRDVASAEISGRVIDPPVLRGRDLFVPSTNGKISAFSLSDDPGQPPLTKGPVYVSEGAPAGSMSLVPGPDGHLWVVADHLSRLRLTTGSLQLDGDPIAAGIASQPLQFLSGFLFPARRRPGSRAVTITRTDRDEMTSNWQMTLGSPVLGWIASGEKNPALTAVTDAGFSYRFAESKLTGQGFATNPAARLPLSARLASPLHVGEIRDHQLAVACGGPDPQVWILNSSGQIEFATPLPEPPQAAPCGIKEAILVPLAGSMHVVRPRGQPPVQPCVPALRDQEQWTSASPAGDDQAIAVTNQGKVLLLQLQPGQTPFLKEISQAQLPAGVHHPGCTSGNRFAVADESHTVALFSTEHLEPVGKRTFEKAVTAPPQWLGESLYLEINRGELHCLQTDEQLSTRWKIPLPQTSLAGLRVHHEQLIIALQNGEVFIVAPESGEILRRLALRTAISRGPVLCGSHLVVAAADGSLIQILDENLETSN